MRHSAWEHFYRHSIGLFLIALIGGVSTASASLNRALTDQEVKALKRNLTENPSNNRSRIFLGEHYLRTKQSQLAIDVLSPITDLLDKETLFKLAESYAETGKIREAQSLVSTLVGNPKVKTKHLLLAARLMSQFIKSSNIATYKIEKTVKKKKVVEYVDPKQPMIDELFMTMRRAQQMDPTNLEIYWTWIEMLEEHVPNYAFEALRVLDDIRDNQIEFTPKLFSLQCRLHFDADFTTQAKRSCEEAIERDPENPSNHIYLGQSHVNTGDDVTGKRVLASIGKRFSESEEALWASAQSFYRSKDMPQAYRFYKKATQHKDSKPRDFLGLAMSAFELQKYDEALAAFTENCRLEGVPHQEFRKASGLLHKNFRLQELFRMKMKDCHPKK